MFKLIIQYQLFGQMANENFRPNKRYIDGEVRKRDIPANTNIITLVMATRYRIKLANWKKV